MVGTTWLNYFVNTNRRGTLAKRRGTQLGNPRIEEARGAARQAHHPPRPAPEVSALIHGWRRQEWTLRRIADELNRLNIKPPRGQQWWARTVGSTLRYMVQWMPLAA